MFGLAQWRDGAEKLGMVTGCKRWRRNSNSVCLEWMVELCFFLWGFSPWHPPKSLNLTVKPLLRCTWTQFLTHVWNTPSQLFCSQREQGDELSQLTLTAYFKFNLKDPHHTHKSINKICDYTIFNHIKLLLGSKSKLKAKGPWCSREPLLDLRLSTIHAEWLL